MNQLYLKSFGEFTSPGKKTFGGEAWKQFEQLLSDCLVDLGYSIESLSSRSEQDENEVVFCAHESKDTDPDSHFFYKQMHLMHLFTMDTIGWGPRHSKMQTAPDLQKINAGLATDFCAHLREQFLTSGHSKLAQPPADQSSETPPKFLLALLQRPHDFMLEENSEVGVLQFIRMLTAWGEQNQLPVLIKYHPANVMDHEVVAEVEACTKNTQFVSVVDGNIHNLIAKSEGVYCINSGTGFESLIHGKPVVTFGQCDYRWQTFQATPETLDQSLQYIRNYSHQQQLLGFQFIYHYCHYHAYSILPEDLERSTRRLKKYLQQHLKAVRMQSLNLVNN